MLHAATISIKDSGFLHEGIGFKCNFLTSRNLDSSACQPFRVIDGSALKPPQPPHVQPAYYAGILINTFIGASGAAQLVELSVNSTNMSGHAAFEGGRLARAVSVNLQSWLTMSTWARPSMRIDFAGRKSTARARRPVIQWHGDDTTDFAGETPNEPRLAGVMVTLVSETVESTARRSWFGLGRVPM